MQRSMDFWDLEPGKLARIAALKGVVWPGTTAVENVKAMVNKWLPKATAGEIQEVLDRRGGPLQEYSEEDLGPDGDLEDVLGKANYRESREPLDVFIIYHPPSVMHTRTNTCYTVS